MDISLWPTVRFGVELIGWLVIAALIVAVVILTTRAVIEERKEAKLRKRAWDVPDVAFQQIREMEVAISQNDIEHQRLKTMNQQKLDKLMERFKERFSYTSLDIFREYVNKKSSANR